MGTQKLNQPIPPNAGNLKGDAFAIALAASVRVLTGRAMMFTGQRAAADDLVQETFERALKSRQRPPAAEVERWLLRILKNAAIDRWRWISVRRRTEVDDWPVDGVACQTLEEPWWRGICSEEVQLAMGSLPNRFQAPLKLRIGGSSSIEIARQLGLQVSTVGTRLFRARQRLRQALETRGHRAQDD